MFVLNSIILKAIVMLRNLNQNLGSSRLNKVHIHDQRHNNLCLEILSNCKVSVCVVINSIIFLPILSFLLAQFCVHNSIKSQKVQLILQENCALQGDKYIRFNLKLNKLYYSSNHSSTTTFSGSFKKPINAEKEMLKYKFSSRMTIQ